MNHIFSHCMLQGPADDNSNALSPLHQSLRYQCSRLGIDYQQTGQAHHTDTSEQSVYTLTVDSLPPVQCTLRAWPSQRPAAGSEASMQAACGLMSVHGRASGQLQALGLPYLSVLTATLAIQGMMASAIGLLRGSNSQQLTLSMLQAGLMATGQYLAGATTSHHAENFLAGTASTQLRPPFVSKDGIVFELETLSPEPWQRFCASIHVNPRIAGQSWQAFLLRYATATADIPETFVKAIGQFTYAELVTLCENSRVFICPQRSLATRATDANCRALWKQGPWSMMPATGTKTTALPVLSGSGLPLQGITVIESCRRIQGPLAGHLLACLGANVIRLEPPAGDPLRLMPPLADGCSARFQALNRLKQVRTVNIKSTQGKNELKELVSHAHVFLHNWAPGKAAQLGLDESDLRHVNANLVYAYAGGWDDRHWSDRRNAHHNNVAQHGHLSRNNNPLRHNNLPGHNLPDCNGAYHNLPGTDFIVQAFSGVADTIARASNIRGGSLFTVLDVAGGTVAAQAVTAALLQRGLTGQGARVDSSLEGAATLLSAGSLNRLWHDKPDRTDDTFNKQTNRSLDSPATSHWHIVSKTRDGILCVECLNQTQLQTLATLLNISTGTCYTDQLKTLISTQAPIVLAQNNTDYWLEKMHATNLIACPVINDLTMLTTQLSTMPDTAHCITTTGYSQVNSPWSFH